MKRIEPGDPEQSLLIWKIRPDKPTDRYGAKMPYSYPALTLSQVELVRQWIQDGVHP
jgi:hypothetical protein